MKLSGIFYKRSPKQVYIKVSTNTIGFVWIDKEKTTGINWKTVTQGATVTFEVSDPTYRQLLRAQTTEPEQLELFDEESEL